MHEIDFSTCSMADVITRSVTCHPTLFRDALLASAKVHNDYSNVTHDRVAARSALGMSSDLRRVADDINIDSFYVDNLTFSERILAFAEAAKLQLIPRATKQDIVSRAQCGVAIS